MTSQTIRRFCAAASTVLAVQAASAQIQIEDQVIWLDPIEVPASEGVLGRCFTNEFMSVTFGPDTDSEYLQDFRAQFEPRRRYQAETRWFRTALDGPVTPLEERITLTWSFVPDGTGIREISLFGELLPTTEASDLHTQMNGSGFFSSEQEWKNLFRQSMDRWGELLAIDYVETVDDGAVMGEPGLAGVRGDIRIGMIPLDGSILNGGGILAYNIFPVPEPVPAEWPGDLGTGAGGDMVLDSADILFFTTDLDGLNFLALRNVTMHEHGHGLGYRHVNPIIGTKLMEASFTGEFDGPQEDDIRGGQHQYGDPLEPNDSAPDATPLGDVSTGGPYEFINIALEDASSTDLFSLTAPERTLLNLEVTPVGTEYLQGPQSLSELPLPVDALRIHDLAVDVLAADGTTIILTLNDAAIGEAEASKLPLLSGAGDYFLRIRPVTATDAAQRYELRMSYEEGSADPEYISLPFQLDDTIGNGNANGAADPGEENLQISVPLRNVGFSTGPLVSAVLVSDTPTAVPISPNGTYASLAPFETDTGTFEIALSPDHVCGEPVALRLVATWGTEMAEFPIVLETGTPTAANIYEITNSDQKFIPSGDILGAASQIGIGDAGMLADLNIRVNITHPRTQELLVYLQGPDGALVELSIGPESGFGSLGTTGANLVDTVFDDQAVESIAEGTAPYTGSFQPANTLSGYVGAPAAGTWSLYASNWLGFTTGTLDSWSVQYTLQGDLVAECAEPGTSASIIDWDSFNF